MVFSFRSFTVAEDIAGARLWQAAKVEHCVAPYKAAFCIGRPEIFLLSAFLTISRKQLG
jgi:hypothetical protein